MASTDMSNFRKLVSESKHIIAVAGAGLSAASGEDHRLETAYFTICLQHLMV